MDDPDTKSGSLEQCSHTKNAQDVLKINPLWPDCILKKVNLAGQGKGHTISIFWGAIFDKPTYPYLILVQKQLSENYTLQGLRT